MKQFSIPTLLIQAAFFAACLLLVLFAVRTPNYASAAGPYVTHIESATTTTAIAVTTSTRLLATTSNSTGTPGVTSFGRVYASICNPNANPVYLRLDADKPASASAATTVIAAAAGYNACYEVTDRNQYSGSITASSTNQTSTTVNVADYVQ